MRFDRLVGYPDAVNSSIKISQETRPTARARSDIALLALYFHSHRRVLALVSNIAGLPLWPQNLLKVLLLRCRWNSWLLAEVSWLFCQVILLLHRSTHVTDPTMQYDT